MHWHCLPSSCLKLSAHVLENLCMLSDQKWTEDKSVWLTSLFSASGHTLLRIVIINAVPSFCQRTQNICIFFVHTKVLCCVKQPLANSKSILLVQRRLWCWKQTYLHSSLTESIQLSISSFSKHYLIVWLSLVRICCPVSNTISSYH